MPGRVITLLASVALAVSITSGVRAQEGRQVRAIPGTEIPTHLIVGSAFIFQHSDTLLLNGRLLRAGIDYRFASGAFDLSRLTVSERDTLVVIYRGVPAWLASSFGRALPEAVASEGSSAMPEIASTSTGYNRNAGHQMVLTGSKTFRFSSRTSGGSDFGQSLDMHIAGEISPGLTLTGTVSDRGFNPEYGTANSRLSELDKVNLRLNSHRFRAQVGDIDVTAFQHDREKTVSGAALDLTFPTWEAHAAAARPRGLHASSAFVGVDGFQGPYQIGQGTTTRPVVPGSETVWLDGRRLERGSGKDYTMDYPSGRITFTVLWPIDSRSRIEVDYEPQASTYKEEMFAAGGGANLTDSAFYVSASVLREGDDKSQPLAGDLSDSDQSLLQSAGDSLVGRSGVTADSSGDYVLVVDSLPDTVYRYVGKPNGEYRIVFGYAGAGKGEYRFLGGDNYAYVGATHGDYTPVIYLPAAERTDYYRAGVGSRTSTLGDLSLDLRASSHDANLWSNRDDGDNDAFLYAARWQRRWQWHGPDNGVSVSRRYREAAYVDRERLNSPDFARRFFLPTATAPAADETRHETNATLTPVDSLVLSGSFDVLDYRDRFSARRGALGFRYRPVVWATLAGEAQTLASDLDGAALSGDGEVNAANGSATFRPLKNWRLGSTAEYDRRRNEYYDKLQGTRYGQYAVTLDRLSGGDIATESATYQRYVEDTLETSWLRSLTRDRLSLSSSRQLGRLSYDAVITGQWLERPDGHQRSLLGRAGGNYYSARRRLGVSAAYTISDERRNARSVTYLEVDPGMGNFILQDGQYIPDPDGNYIEVEQLLSDTARVRRGEKSFSIDKAWAIGSVRFASEIQEELKEGGKRTLWWLVPFVADADQPYLFFSSRYSGEAHVLPLRQGASAVNMQVTQSREKREVASRTSERRDETARLWLKQPAGDFVLEQSAELFRYRRDSLYSGSGDVDGYRIGLGLRRVYPRGEISGAVAYRSGDAAGGARSRLVSFETGARAGLWARGELRGSAELYTQQLDNVTLLTSYQLTGNRSGTRGVVWSLYLNYGLKGQVRMNLSLNGRHSNDRPGRVYGRGEVVAGF